MTSVTLSAEQQPVILIIAMSRPDELRRILDILSLGKPSNKKLLVVDRYEGIDEVKVSNNQEVIKIAKSLPSTDNYSVVIQDFNLGCKQNVEYAVGIAFEMSPFVIVIEDDLLFDISMLDYFDECFRTYKNADIGFYNGCSFNFQINSPHLTRFFHGWGWAITRGFWNEYMSSRDSLFWDVRDLRHHDLVGWSNNELSALEALGKMSKLSNVPRGRGGLDTWDYQFSYFCLLSRKRGVAPGKSLFANLGFNFLGTHTRSGETPQPIHHVWSSSLDKLFLASDEHDFEELRRLKRCRLCSSSVSNFSAIKSDLGFPLIFSECESCHLIQVVDVDWIGEAYNSGLDFYDQGAVQRSLRFASLVISILDGVDYSQSHEALKKNKLKSVLDYGSGSGLMARLLRDANVECESFDKYSPSSLNSGFHYSMLPSVTYDVVTCIEVIEHIADFNQFISDIRNLNPYILVLGTELYSNEGANWKYFSPFHGQHISIFSGHTITHLANELSMSVALISKGIQILTRDVKFLNINLDMSKRIILSRIEESGPRCASRDQEFLLGRRAENAERLSGI